MVTLRDIAKKASVSTATVSNVLNDTLYVSPVLRERVLTAARLVGYRPNSIARSLRTKSSHTVGIIVPDVTNPFFPAVVRGAEDVLTRAGFTLIIGNSDNDPEKEGVYYRTFLDRQVDGLLTVPTRDEAPPILEDYKGRGIPVVYVDREYIGEKADVVMADNVGGSEACVRHLVKIGRRRIAAVTGPLSLGNARERLEGYRRALAAANLKVDGRLIREGAFDVASGRTCALELLQLEPRPDALFLANALMACGAYEALERTELSCPNDVAVACFDRLDFFDLLRPRLTSVAAPSYELGVIGAELVLDRIRGKLRGSGQRHLLRTQLIQRESTGVARKRRECAVKRSI
jgi:DNA-binding LacI/PurR family transcriptional regulator